MIASEPAAGELSGAEQDHQPPDDLAEVEQRLARAEDGLFRLQKVIASVAGRLAYLADHGQRLALELDLPVLVEVLSAAYLPGLTRQQAEQLSARSVLRDRPPSGWSLLGDLQPDLTLRALADEMARWSVQDVDAVERLAAARQNLAHEFAGRSPAVPVWAATRTADRAVRVLEACWWLRAVQGAGLIPPVDEAAPC